VSEELRDPTRRNILQLTRLERVTDVVYALVLWRLFVLIPRPELGVKVWPSFVAYAADHAGDLVLILVGIVVLIVYWLQSNVLFGTLAKTDGRHTTYSIFGLFFMMLLLLAIKTGMDLGASPRMRLFESVTAALVGYMSVLAFFYATKKRRLLHSDVSDEEVKRLRERITAEPLAATITMPFAFVGPWAWELSWFAYPMIVGIIKKRQSVATAS
jgi:uncharacterized membrane protein